MSKKTYYERKNSGLCVDCGEPREDLNVTRCNKCIQVHNDYYNLYKQHHICVKCKKNDALPNRVMCEECSEKRAKRYWDYMENTTLEQKKEDADNRNKQRRELGESRRKQGLCPRCGKKALKGHVRCLDCSLKDVRYSKEHRRKEKSNKPIDSCYRCSKPCMLGRKLCKEHYEQTCKALELGRNCQKGIESRKEHKKKYDAFWAEMKYKGDKSAS